MSQPSLLDFDAILAPISDGQPCGFSFDTGENTSLSHAFSELRALTPIARKIEAKRFELAGMGPSDRQESLTHSEGKSDGPQADPKWGRIADLAVEILTRYSKDTRVMVSLVEAMTRVNGLTGMRDAFKASSLLLERYQLSLYPTPDPGAGVYYCLEFIGKICESEQNNIKSAIYQAEIFEEPQGLCWFSHISASNLEKRSPSEKEEYLRAGELSLDHFNSALNNIGNASELLDFDVRIAEALAEAQNFDKLLTQYSDKRIGIGRIVDDLLKLQRWYRGLIDETMKRIAASAPVEPVDDGSTPTTEASAGTVAQVGARVQLSNREQALNSLLQVASYFRSVEPHSPLSYALEQAVRWGKMPLPDLLRDLVADESVLSEVYRRMGIQESPEKSDR